MKNKTKLLLFAKWLVVVAQEEGHVDAKIINTDNVYKIRIHAGLRDAWNPCGYNETITISQMNSCYNIKTKKGWYNNLYKGIPPWGK